MLSIFEKIINREIPAYIVYEDEDVIAFLDISQATKGHTLVVPKIAYKNIFEIPEDVLENCIKVVKKVSLACKKAFPLQGLNVLNNNETIAGQSVFHFHFHVIPRYEAHDIAIEFKNNSESTSKEEYKKRALMIQEAL